ncbi:enediyne biosynthesis protein UnbU [Nocardiopsis sp. TSRI0078]|uniref:RnfABCDGE type electron transport complex subunit D n=1 Tax=unclassified Nocardiopsis TaxID=2649073 RepID=UPI00093F3D3B|nr:RnfABCDGE type electron transport complex subunit D [Nocardiopsis sp. TSRI0078]OKI23462.1 enediyne biosynthesis protein UnbU [Nocardiopsis sp. TSRI0078]
MTVTRPDEERHAGAAGGWTGTPAPAEPAAKPPVDRRVKALRMFATSITVFTVVGHFLLGFEQSPITPIAAVLFGYALDLLLETMDARAAGRRPQYMGGAGAAIDYLLPTHIAGLACAMLLWGNTSLWPYLFAVSIAVSSKYVFRIPVGGRRRHFLNPSNLGIAVTLLLFPWVGIAPPYHFTNNAFGTVDWLIPLGILMAGTMLNVNLTKRWPLILGWVGGFVLQAVLRWLVLDHMLVAALMPLTGVAFILFTNYMITDPGTTPSKPRNQMVFGLTTAAVYGLLVSLHVVFGLFFALVITCALRGLVLVCAPWFPRGGGAATAPGAPAEVRAADR